MKPLLLTVLLLSSQPLVHTDMEAGTQSDAVVALHVSTSPFKGDPCINGPPSSCSEFVVDEVPIDRNVWAFLLVAMADSTAGVAGVSCGIASGGGLLMGGWNLCADMDNPAGGWLSTGEGGNQISWDPDTNCQRGVREDKGVHTLAGAFPIYAYAIAWVEITANTTTGPPEYTVTDCMGEVSGISLPGPRVGFATEKGFNPCLSPTPVEPATWTKIKARYGN